MFTSLLDVIVIQYIDHAIAFWFDISMLIYAQIHAVRSPALFLKAVCIFIIN